MKWNSIFSRSISNSFWSNKNLKPSPCMTRKGVKPTTLSSPARGSHRESLSLEKYFQDDDILWKEPWMRSYRARDLTSWVFLRLISRFSGGPPSKLNQEGIREMFESSLQTALQTNQAPLEGASDEAQWDRPS